ncbi:MAG: hypothetical protein MI919_31495 [Holophagales bacterium]|nr:hypothetical protein [Holophagales bacterium]
MISKSATLLVLLALLVCGSALAEPWRAFEVHRNPASESDVDTGSAALFGNRLIEWATGQVNPADLSPGPYRLPFHALSQVFEKYIADMESAIYRHDWKSDHIEDLIAVRDAGFVDESVWRHHHETSWTEPPACLELPAFDRWAKSALSDHTARLDAVLEVVEHP